MTQLSLFPSAPGPSASALRIKCLSLWQPWASLVATGAKPWETRSYPAARLGLKTGELLAIHAAKKWDNGLLAQARQERFVVALAEAGLSPTMLPPGAVLCICRYLGSTPTWDFAMPWDDDQGLKRYWLTAREEAFGDYGEGRSAWRLEVLHRFEEPVPAKGRQGVFWWECPVDVAPEWMREAAQQ